MPVFSKAFLFTFNSNYAQYDWWLLVIFIAFLAAAAAARILQFFLRERKLVAKLYSRLFRGLITAGVLGGIWIALRKLAVPVFGYRFSALLILLGFLIWLGFLLFYIFTRFFTERRQYQEQQVKERYLKVRR